MRRQHFLVYLVIFFASLSYFFIQYDRLRETEPGLQAWYQEKIAGTLNEGDQYRVGLPFVSHFLELHTPLKMRQSIPLIEFLCYGLGLACLYGLLIRSDSYREATGSHRLAILGFFIAAIQFPVLWIFPWERPETLPTMFYLALMSFVIIDSRIPMAVTCIIAIAASSCEAFARTDAPMVLGLATVLCAAFSIRFRRSRLNVALLGILCAGAGLACQLYLRSVFPSVHPSQRATTLQLFRNFDLLQFPFRAPESLLALLPLFVTLALIRRRPALDSSDKLTLAIALVYLPIYMTWGIISEVRIYVPYLFLMAPTMAKIWSGFLSRSLGMTAQKDADSAAFA